METPKAPGRIITFYSYKGGTGRSMALANTAWLLAAAGRKVLMVDWDLEAPGLHRYVHPFLDDPDLTSSEGVIDFVISYTEEASSKTLDETLDPKWFAPYANIVRFATPLDYDFPDGGSLDFIPAGKQGPAYAGRVNSFNWKDFYVKLGGRAVIQEACARMRDRYEFILIDSRTGVSDTSGICTVEMPDDVVVCFTLNMQSVTGANSAARSMLEQRITNPLHLFPVAMRVETAEKIKTDTIREYAKRKFLDLMSDDAVEPKARDEYWHDVEVPQIPFYAFEEQLAYFLDAPNQLGGVLGSMKRLVWRLTTVDVRNAPGPEPAVRNQILSSYSGVWAGAVQKAGSVSPEVVRQFVYISDSEFGAVLAGAGTPRVRVPNLGFSGSLSGVGRNLRLPVDSLGLAPAVWATDLVTRSELARSGSWGEAFRTLLRRSRAMLVVVEEQGLSPMQQRELAFALEQTSRAPNSAFRIKATAGSESTIPLSPGLAALNGNACPYPGLAPFQAGDAPVFFGREAFLERLADQMVTAQLTVLGGKPGTGKTSAVMAGLIPELLLRDAPRPSWKVVVCDLARPLEAFIEALVRTRGTAQFAGQVAQETAELVARTDKEGIGIFKEVVPSVLSAWPPADRLAIIVEGGTSELNSEYVKVIREVPSVSLILISEGPSVAHIELPPLSQKDVIRAIEQPALRAGALVEPGLAARIASDLDGQDDALALLQFCLVRLWERHTAGVIHISDYVEIGGIEEVVAKWADRILNTLPPREQDVAIRLMCRMLSVSTDSAITGAGLRSDSVDEASREILIKLWSAGLVTSGLAGISNVQDYFLFHAELALRWPRLKQALDQNSEFFRWRERFQAAQQEFALRQSYSALLRDLALTRAQGWLKQRPDEFTPQEVEFIRRSEAEAKVVDERAAPSSRRTGRLVAGFLLVLGVFLSYYFYSQTPKPPAEPPLVKGPSGDLQGAIASLTQRLPGADPISATQIYSDRAYYYKLSGDWDKSISDLTQALGSELRSIEKARLFKDRGYAYVQLRRPDAALSDYADALKLDPNDRDAAFNYAFLRGILMPTGSGVPPVFVFMKPVSGLGDIPQAVMKLYPKPVAFLNIRGWGNPIPANELRYSEAQDEPLARNIIDALARGGITAKGPVLTAFKYRHLELWLATEAVPRSVHEKPSQAQPPKV